MFGGTDMQIRPRKILYLFIVALFILPGCLDFGGADEDSSTSEGGPITIEVWHTFAAESKEEVAFTNAVRDFETAHPNIPLR